MEGEGKDNDNDTNTLAMCECKAPMRSLKRPSQREEGSGQGLAFGAGKLPTRSGRGVERKRSRPDQKKNKKNKPEYPSCCKLFPFILNSMA